MEPTPSIIVRKLNCISIKKAQIQIIKAYIKLIITEIFPDGIGLFLVLLTCLSKSLSITSFTIHPALLIKTEPKKNRTKKSKKISVFGFIEFAYASPQEQGQNSNIIPVGLFNLVNSIKTFK
tara:strand:- start:188 stop:553 length:366 start_codon:yes stop_codon:yes gene_type:complete